MAALLNRARMSTSTTGTGTITLDSAVTGYFSFAEAGAADATVYSYTIEDGDDFEIGVGTYTSSGTTFSRDTVTASKIGGTAGTSKIDLSGAAQIFITMRAGDLGEIPSGGTTGQIPAKASNADADIAWTDPVDVVEGTWTPTLFGSTTAGTPTYTFQVGGYSKIGNQVTVTARLTISATGSPAGSMRIGGLPFPVRNVTNEIWVGAVVGSNINWTDTMFLGISTSAGQSYININLQGDNAATANLNATMLTATSSLLATLTYLTE